MKGCAPRSRKRRPCMASEASRKKAEALLAGSFVEHTEECQHALWDEPGCTCGREELREAIAAALDEALERGGKEALVKAVPLKELMSEALAEAREEGARRERWECRDVAWRCACERAAQLSAMGEAGNADAVAGKSAEAGRIADAIASRGPMLAPEEGEE